MLDAYTHQPRLNTPEVVTNFDHPSDKQLLQDIIRDRWLIDRVDSLARPEGLRFVDIEDPEHEHPIIMCRPTMTANIFALRTQYARTVTLISYATGTTPSWIAPVIEKLTQNGVPVFLVADCPGDKAGITRISYQASIPSLKAGATIIEKVNIRDARLVKEAAKDWSTRLSGKELADYIGQMFAYQEGEKRPLPEWQNPDAIENYRINIVKPFLRRIGVTGDDVEEVSKIWETRPTKEYFKAIQKAQTDKGDIE